MSKRPIAEQIADKLAEIDAAKVELETLEAEPLPTFLPSPTEPGNSTALLVPGEGESGPLATRLEEAKKLITQKRNQLSLAQKRFLKLRSELNDLVASQTAGLSKLEEKYSAKLANISTALDAANLYLGRDEEYTVLRTGAKAPADSPICIRQSVLFMDEESAMYKMLAEEGGITFETVPKFDEWLLADPKHLTQVLPEEKGIVGVRIRRHEKDRSHEDPIAAAMKAAMDKMCFFLLRNGENLYRLENNCPPIAETLIPTTHEFQKLFEDPFYRFQPNDETQREEYLRPGTEAFNRAMKRSKGKHIHYLKIALAIQGVLDRTQIFHPLPEHLQKSGQAGNIFAAAAGEEASNIRIIRDLENVLVHSNPSFDEWLKTRNQFTTAGSRIVLGNADIGSDNIEPYHVARDSYKRPDTYIDYIAEAHPIDEGKFTIRFVYEQYWGKESPRRAKAHLHKSSRGYLNIDDPDGTLEEEIHFYLNDRLERQNYTTSIPLLVRALRIIEKERIEEIPFVTLCVSMLKVHFRTTFPKKDVPEDTVFEKLSRDCVTWFKRKNKLQRALRTRKSGRHDVPDDNKAFVEVCAEAKRRLEKLTRGETKSHRDEQVKTTILALRPQTSFLGQKEGGFYVSLEPEGPETLIAQPGFHKEILWRWDTKSNQAELREEKRWSLKNPRHTKLRKIFSTQAWEDMPDNLRKNDRLTEDEIQQLARALKTYSDKIQAEQDTYLFAATFDPQSARFSLYGAGNRFADKSYKEQKETLSISIGWEKKQDTVRILTGYRQRSFYSTYWIDREDVPSFEKEAVNAEHLQSIPLSCKSETEQLLWIDEKKQEKALKVMQAYWAERAQDEAERELSSSYWDAFRRGYDLTLLAEEKRLFLEEEGGVEELWEEHLKTLPAKRRAPAENLNHWGTWRYGLNALIEKGVLDKDVDRTQAVAPSMAEIIRLNTEHQTGWVVEKDEAHLAKLPWVTPPTLAEIWEARRKEEEAEEAEEQTDEASEEKDETPPIDLEMEILPPEEKPEPSEKP